MEYLPGVKLSTWDGRVWTPVRSEDVWEVEQTAGPRRLVIAPAEGHVDVLLSLAETWGRDYYILYLLLVPRRDTHLPGRYQPPGPLSFEDVSEFCSTFRDFLETDGRHHVWIGSTTGTGTLVYDQHNVLFAYGDLGRYLDVLKRRGFRPGPVRFPAPHGHLYHPSNDEAEDRLIGHWNWTRFPLQAGDEWD